MKKCFSLTSLILAASFILGACSSDTEPVNAPAVMDPGISTDDYAYGFDYDDDHKLYYLTLRDTGEVEIFPASKEGESLMCENSPKFTQSEYYEDLKEVYKNADVRFSYSGEVVMNDFYGYLEGKITLDDFIREANRKLSAYLNE